MKVAVSPSHPKQTDDASRSLLLERVHSELSKILFGHEGTTILKKFLSQNKDKLQPARVGRLLAKAYLQGRYRAVGMFLLRFPTEEIFESFLVYLYQEIQQYLLQDPALDIRATVQISSLRIRGVFRQIHEIYTKSTDTRTHTDEEGNMRNILIHPEVLESIAFFERYVLQDGERAIYTLLPLKNVADPNAIIAISQIQSEGGDEILSNATLRQGIEDTLNNAVFDPRLGQALFQRPSLGWDPQVRDAIR